MIRATGIMKITNFRTWTALIACAFLSAPAYALGISDLGVAGGFWTGGQLRDVSNVTAWGNHLLGLDADETETASASGDNNLATENYKTGRNYDGTLGGGTLITGTVSEYDWVVARYGDNRYVLYDVPDLPGNTIPLTSGTIWTKQSGQSYPLSAGLIGYQVRFLSRMAERRLCCWGPHWAASGHFGGSRRRDLRERNPNRKVAAFERPLLRYVLFSGVYLPMARYRSGSLPDTAASAHHQPRAFPFPLSQLPLERILWRLRHRYLAMDRQQ